VILVHGFRPDRSRCTFTRAESHLDNFLGNASISFDVVSVVDLDATARCLTLASYAAAVLGGLDELWWAALVELWALDSGAFGVDRSSQSISDTAASRALIVGWRPCLANSVGLVVVLAAILDTFAAALAFDRHHNVAF